MLLISFHILKKIYGGCDVELKETGFKNVDDTTLPFQMFWVRIESSRK